VLRSLQFKKDTPRESIPTTQVASTEARLFCGIEKYANRIALCESCEQLFKPTFSCKKCFCFMRIKAAFDDMACPEKKW
jgi:hypothetical protein